MTEEPTRGNHADSNRTSAEPDAPSGWVTTKQAARSLGVSPRTVRWHIDKGNLEAKPEGEGVKRTWYVSIDSLQAFRYSRQDAGGLPRSNRVASGYAEIATDIPGNPIRELADRLAEEAARAAEYRVRLELTEQAQTSLEEELAAERVRREQAERERDELRLMLEASSEPEKLSERVSETIDEDEVPPPETQHPVERPSWWRRFFGFE
jgi:Helix-turn-helix domain